MTNLLPLVIYRHTLQRFCRLPRQWPLTRPYTPGTASRAPENVASTLPSTTARYWTNEETDDLKRMDRNRVPLRTIAESLGRTVSSIRNRLHRIRTGGPLSTSSSTSPYSLRRWSNDETTWAVRLKEEGHSWSQIAKILNRTPRSVRNKLSNRAQDLSEKPLTFQEWEVLQKMKRDGAKCCTIARSLNRDTRNVRNWMDRQYYESPSHLRYTAVEDQQLRDLVENSTPWREIQRLMPHRTVRGLEKRYRCFLRPSASSVKLSPWKIDELETLQLLVKAGRSHKEIASRLNRSMTNVTNRIHRDLGHMRRRNTKWSSEELALLKSMREEGKTYKLIAAAMKNRTASGCARAYHNYLQQ